MASFKETVIEQDHEEKNATMRSGGQEENLTTKFYFRKLRFCNQLASIHLLTWLAWLPTS